MYLRITKQHKSNGGQLLKICRYGYFRKDKGWELITLNAFGLSFHLFRYKRYFTEWPVCCG